MSGYNNHVLKVGDTDLINVRYLWRFISRGAMMICANNQRGDDALSRDTVTAVPIQLKDIR
jgi:hypothetical protein